MKDYKLEKRTNRMVELLYYRRPMKLRECNVFSHVRLFTGVPCNYYPWCIGPHCTGTPWLVQTCSTWASRYSSHLPPATHLGPGPIPWCWYLMDTVHWTSLYKDPLVLTPGGYWSMYSWQVGSIHPTGMLSCFSCERNPVLNVLTTDKEFGAWREITHIGSCYQLQLPKCNTAARWLEQTATVTHCFSMEGMCCTDTTHIQIWQILRFWGLLNIFMWEKSAQNILMW